MKKLLSLCLALMLVGCSAAPAASSSGLPASSSSAPSSVSSAPPSSSSVSEASSDSASGKDVDMVTVTLSASTTKNILDDDFDPEKYAKESGFDSVTVLEDNSICIVMSKKKHEELMKDMNKQLLEKFDDMANDPDAPYVKDINANSDFTKITMIVDKAAYKAAFDVTSIGVIAAVGLYNTFKEEPSTLVLQVQDEATKEIFYEKSF